MSKAKYPNAMLTYALPLAILLMGVLYIVFIPAEPAVIKLLFKLIPMGLILLYAYLQHPAGKTGTTRLLIAGLLFCMLGDGLLVYWFVPGLAAFLTGHLFYIAAFWGRRRLSRLRLASLLPIGAYSVFMGARLVDALKLGGDYALTAPVLAYILVISLMLWSSMLTGNRWAITGSLLFVVSDSILAWNKFVSEVPYSNALIMSTYYAAQFLIARSIARFVSEPGKLRATPETPEAQA